MNNFLDPDRIAQARRRRGLSKLDLARAMRLTPRTLTRYETDGAPLRLAEALSDALGFPPGFFMRPVEARIEGPQITFQNPRASARARHAAVAAAELSVEVDWWISDRFKLPTVAVPSLHDHDPELAAGVVRGLWALGVNPLPNSVQLVESRGVRVYLLPRVAAEVRSFSAWLHAVPYIFLSRSRSPEAMRRDVLLEVGHLVLHPVRGNDAEDRREADRFATEFLIPTGSVFGVPRHPTLHQVLDAAERHRVTPGHLARALHGSGWITDWDYRQLRLDLADDDEGSMTAHERSGVFKKVLASVRATSRFIASDLNLPVGEVRAMMFGEELGPADPRVDLPARGPGGDPNRQRQLRVV